MVRIVALKTFFVEHSKFFPSSRPGVPQASVLSPTLFIVYTYDLIPLLNTEMRVIVAAYADDIHVHGSCYESDKNPVRAAIQDSISEMQCWAPE